MSEINVTPLVDVMLVLLIIFMVTAPMMQEGLNVDLPQASGAPVTKDQQANDVVIEVSPDKVSINGAEVQEDKLGEKILETTKDKPARDVYLRADKNVSYGKVVGIMDTLKAAGVSNLGMITAPKEGPASGK